MNENSYTCSFCKNEFSKDIVVSKEGAAICRKCAAIAHGGHQQEASSKITQANLMKIYAMAKNTVIGQESALEKICTAFKLHIDRIKYNKVHAKKIKKSNLLVVGPTGVGKTLTVETVAGYFNLPFASIDATSITEKGYVGEDPDIGFVMLLKFAKGNLEKAERGIIFVDEIDKIAKKSSMGMVRDISGEGVQQSMLRMMDGSNIIINEQRKGGIKNINFNTSNVMFVLGGAFVGMEDIVRQRKQQNRIGLLDAKNKSDHQLTGNILHEDIVKYGFLQEFVGRIGQIVPFVKLTRSDLSKIVEINYEQIRGLFQYKGIQIDMDEEAKEAILNITYESEFGARKIKSVIEGIFSSIYFDSHKSKSKSFQVTKSDVEAIWQRGDDTTKS